MDQLLKGILDQLNYLGGIGPLCTHVQVLATWTHLNGWLEHDVFAIGLQHQYDRICCCWTTKTVGVGFDGSRVCRNIR